MAARRKAARPWAGWPGADEVAEFEAYLDSRGDQLRGRALLLAGNRADAADFLHRALAQALASWPRLRASDDIDARVDRILVSAARDAARRRRGRATATATATAGGRPGGSAAGGAARLPVAAMLVDEAARLRGRRERTCAALLTGVALVTVIALFVGVGALRRPGGTPVTTGMPSVTATVTTSTTGTDPSPSSSAAPGTPAAPSSPARSSGTPIPTPTASPVVTPSATPRPALRTTPSATRRPAPRPTRRAPATGAPATPAARAVRIDAGGSGAGAYGADDAGAGGQVADDPDRPVALDGVAAPAPERVYQSCRWGARLDYRVGGLVPGAAYLVRLHWAELDFPYPGQRVFAVAVNGATVLPQVDVVAMAGGRLRALVRDVPARAGGDGAVTVTLTRAGPDNPFLSALEVLPR